MLNVVQTTIVEEIAKSPKTPWILPEGAVPDTEAWANPTGKAYITYNQFNPDDSSQRFDPPTRNNSEPAIQNMLAVAAMLENNLKASTSMFDPSLGNKMSGDQSGLAIKALQTAGSISNYHFSDNLSRAIRLCGRMLIDLIPKVYNEKKVIRIVGGDQTHSLVSINTPGNDPDNINEETGEDGIKKIYDVTVGDYDVSVDSGPSYQTKRAENLNSLLQLAGKDPNLMAAAGDIIVSQMDFPAAKELQERLTPPQFQTNKDKQSPAQMAQQLQQYQQMCQKLTQQLQQETQLADKVSQDQQTRLQIAQLEAQTELTKHQTQLSHDSNKTVLQAEIERLKLESQQSHELIKSVHAHLLNKDLATHNTALDMASLPENPVTSTKSNTAL